MRVAVRSAALALVDRGRAMTLRRVHLGGVRRRGAGGVSIHRLTRKTSASESSAIRRAAGSSTAGSVSSSQAARTSTASLGRATRTAGWYHGTSPMSASFSAIIRTRPPESMICLKGRPRLADGPLVDEIDQPGPIRSPATRDVSPSALSPGPQTRIWVRTARTGCLPYAQRLTLSWPRRISKFRGLWSRDPSGVPQTARSRRRRVHGRRGLRQCQRTDRRERHLPADLHGRRPSPVVRNGHQPAGRTDLRTRIRGLRRGLKREAPGSDALAPGDTRGRTREHDSLRRYQGHHDAARSQMPADRAAARRSCASATCSVR